MNPNDYDEDGNNIVPCPICLSVHCPSKEGEKCPEEDAFVKAHTDPYKEKHKCTGTGVCGYCKPNGFNGTAGEVGSTLDQDLHEAQQEVVLKRQFIEKVEGGKITYGVRDEKIRHFDPYEAQGKVCKHGFTSGAMATCSCTPKDRVFESNLRVNHPPQPKTQVERWREERKLNEEAIANCGCRVLPILSNIGDVFDCKKEGTDNCNERFKKIDELQSKILIATQPIHPRYPTGEFGDDIENAPEYIKKSLFGNNFRKVTLLDKIKKLLQ